MLTPGSPWEQLATAVDTWEIGVYEWRHDTGKFSGSPRYIELYGLEDRGETIEGAAAWTMVHPDDRGRFEAAFRRATNAQGSGEIQLVHRVVHAGGEVLWLHLSSRTTFEQIDGEQRPVRTWGSVMDVTERQQIEQELRRTESRIVKTLRSAHIRIY